MSDIPCREQRILDQFYAAHGPCCAGCDWWRWLNSVIGECHRSAPVSGRERTAMIGIRVHSQAQETGHIMTPREHVCGDFRDEFDWSSLPAPYLRSIGKESGGCWT